MMASTQGAQLTEVEYEGQGRALNSSAQDRAGTGLLVFRRDQSVMEDSEDLIPPETHKLSGCGEAGWASQEKPLCDPREVSQVEDIVES